MQIVWLVTVIVVVSGGPSDWSYPSTCAPKNTVILDPGAPPNTKLPPVPVLPQKFQVRVEVNMLDKNSSSVAYEFYDFYGHRAALQWLVNNTMKYVYFDYASNQSIYVFNSTLCEVENLNSDENRRLFGNLSQHVHTTPGALIFAKANGLMYKGTKVVRGIQCDWWQSCIYWPTLSNFTLDYYFSAYNWVTSDLTRQVPVLAEVTGTRTDQTGTQSFIHHMYEYFDFRHRLLDTSVFETPAGIVCPGRRTTRKVPLLPDVFSMTEEIISQYSVSIAKVYINSQLNLVRFDYQPPFKNFPYYVQNTLVTEIHDYNTGIAYGIDRLRGNCSIFPIRNASFDSVVETPSSHQQYYLRMKSGNELFFLDNTTYTYEGTRTVREILCDVFISKRTDFRLPGYQDFESIFEIYFMNKQFGDGSGDTAVPIQMRIHTPDWVGYEAIYNIFDFSAENQSLELFSDLAPCFNAKSKTAFRIEFPGTWDDSLMEYNNMLLAEIVANIAIMINVSPLRIQDTQLIVESDAFYFIATLLERPPSIAFFQKQPGHVSQFQSFKAMTANSASDCANYCNNPGTSSSCDSFVFCSDRQSCLLRAPNNQGRGTVHSLGTDMFCDQYVRTAQSYHKSTSLSDALMALKNNVIHGKLQLDVNSGQPGKITAGSIDVNILRHPQRTLSTKALMDKFSVQRNKGVTGFNDLIITGVSVDDCASACLNAMSFVCNAFSFDFAVGYCLISKLHPDERPSAISNRMSVDLYIKKYTVDYEKVTGTTVLSSSNVIYQNVNSADICAKLCSLYGSFSCKSFDYCGHISTCYLGRTHFYDVPKADKIHSPICNHYSRNYLSDFKQTTRLHLVNADDRIISGVSVTQCAKLCVEEETNDCASFGYCGNTTECRLSTASMRNIGQVSSEPSLWCDVYSRQTFPDGTPYTPKSSKCVSPPPSTASVISAKSTPSTLPDTNKSVMPSDPTTSNTGKSTIATNTGKSTIATNTGKSTIATNTRKSTPNSSTTKSKTTSNTGKSTATPSTRKSSISSSSTKGQKLSSQTPYTNKPSKYGSSSPSNGKGLSAGGVVGVALGMLVVGFLIAAFAYVGIKKFKRRLPEEMKVAFAKEDVAIN